MWKPTVRRDRAVALTPQHYQRGFFGDSVGVEHGVVVSRL